MTLGFIRNISSNKSDTELVDDYRRTGDLNTLGDLYQRYMELIYGVCLKYFKDPDDAQDAVLNIFEELVGKLLKHEVQNFRSWLHQLAKNHCLMKLRSDKKMPNAKVDLALVQSEENLHLNGVFEKEENFRVMEACLERLPAEQRSAIQLFYLEGKCYNEIADSIGIEWKKVRSYIQNGRRNLKICMEKHQTVIERNG